MIQPGLPVIRYLCMIRVSPLYTLHAYTYAHTCMHARCIHPSIHPPIHPSFDLSIHLSIHPYLCWSTQISVNVILAYIETIEMQICEIIYYVTSVTRQKGESQNGCFKKTKNINFPKNEHFLSPDMHMQVFRKIWWAFFSGNTCFEICPLL